MSDATRVCGTRSAYVGGCRCQECAEANTLYFRDYYVRYRLPIERTLVPAGPVEAHVRRLRAAGMGKRQIARAAGVAVVTVQRLSAGDTRRGVHARVAAAILAVRVDTWLRDATGAQRRVRALAALGWTVQQIAAEAGVAAHVVGDLSAAARGSVTKPHDDAIRVAYERLSMRRGPSVIAARRAADHGYAPPLAWDDADLDDPTARPCGTRDVDADADHAVIARVLAGESMRTSVAERVVLVPALARLGLSDPQIADRCRCTARTVLRIRQGLGVESRWAA